MFEEKVFIYVPKLTMQIQHAKHSVYYYVKFIIVYTINNRKMTSINITISLMQLQHATHFLVVRQSDGLYSKQRQQSAISRFITESTLLDKLVNRFLTNNKSKLLFRNVYLY